ncbi:LysR family transcriptional regulator [Nocardioides cavernaquae]|uniref:LysR family transcriptional regulator n=1 Tax=Nocardioides cavernaquae TaxID=2321396 RepID=A0A3A5H4F9_9ACTN|nr:LysR family transcriptional regulator [Nocardioides cavernaquae]RJS45502.1 LysR family transcriptional regulator [Nocardioides cavernaquae]
MTSLDLLATFLEIHRAGSLSAAADRLGVSQPTVSGHLARLEAQLGEQLFVRSRDGAAPTPRASALAARIGSSVDTLRGAVAEPAPESSLTGTVRIGGASDVMALQILPALAPLVGRGLTCQARLGLAAELLDDLRAGRLDLVVSSVRPVPGPLVAAPFIDEEFVLVGSPGMARTVDAERLAADPAGALGHLPLIAYGEELPVIRRYWRSEFGRRPSNPVAVIVPDLRAACALARAGAGITVLPTYVASEDLAAGALVRLHEPDFAPLNTLYLVVRRGAVDPVVALVQQCLREAAAEWVSL